MNIAKNTSFFTLALVIQKIITFGYFTVLARNLDPSDLGKYYLAISLTTIFAIFIDLGLANVLTREVARDNSDDPDKKLALAGRLLGSVLAIKLPLAVLSWLAVFAMVNLLGYPEITKQLVIIASISMILDSFTLAFYSVMRGFHNLMYESIGSVIFQLLVLIGGLSALKAGLGLQWIMAALAIASVFNFLFALCLALFRFKIRFSLSYDKFLIKKIILISVPFALYAVFQRLYMYLDTVLLSILAGDEQVGYYQIAFKIIFSLQFLPMAFMASLYPAFSAYYRNNREQLMISFERAFNYLSIISLPISLGVIILADEIIKLFKPEYSAAVPVLQVIMLSLIFIFLNFPIGSLLNATDRQKINTRNMGISLLASILLNLILIPKFQTLGAAITVVVTNMLMFCLGIFYMPKIINLRIKKIFSLFIRALAAALLMSIIVYVLKTSINVFAVVLIGGAFYFIFLYLIGGFKKEDVISVIESFKGKKN